MVVAKTTFTHPSGHVVLVVYAGDQFDADSTQEGRLHPWAPHLVRDQTCKQRTEDHVVSRRRVPPLSADMELVVTVLLLMMIPGLLSYLR